MIAKRHALARCRRMIGYSQERLAEMLGVERSTMQRWEAGENYPQPWCRPRLAKALAVSMVELDTMLANGETVDDTPDDLPDEHEYDPVLTSPWNHRGTVEAVVVVAAERPSGVVHVVNSTWPTFSGAWDVGGVEFTAPDGL